MASRDVKFLANLGLHGSLRFLESNADFPENPSIGDMLLKGTELYAYIKIGDLETWVPVSNRTNSYIHTQGIAQLDWTVTHNLGTTDVWTQIRDSNNDIVYAAMDNITANSFQLHFTEAITGTVVVVAPDSIDVPAVTTSIIQVGNVEITGSNITINGQAVLTGGDFATVAETGLFSDLLSKPTTLLGYGITDAQPLDADLSAIAALNTTGFLKRTGVDTWSLDNSNYITGNQNITISGDASGSGTTAITLTLANSGVTAGDYTKVTVNGKGLVTGGSNPTTLAGYGITDAAPLTHVGSGGAAHAAATTSTSGFMSATDKTKLNGIEENANNYSLPIATSTILGGIKEGNGVGIDANGVISADVLSVAGRTGDVVLTKSDVGLSNVENKSSSTIRSEITSTNVTDALGFTPENSANKGVANGYAGLDANSKISSSHLPAIAITNTFVVASQAAMLALSVETGDVAVRTDLNKSFILQGTDPSVLADWQELLTPTDLVQSVNGMTGTVTISTISGNAGTATALQTARTLWGQSFDGSANVTGNLTSVGNITGTGAVTLTATSGTLGLAATGANVITLSTNSTERMRVDSSGNVGIGATPATKFQVTHAGLLQGRFYNTSNGTDLRIVADTDHAGIKLDNSGMPLLFSLGGSEAARFAATTKNLLINTSTDDGTNKLQVNGTASILGNVLYVGPTSASSGSGANIRLRDDTGTTRWLTGILGSAGATAYAIYDITTSTERLYIPSSGNVLIGTTTDSNRKLQVYGSGLFTDASGIQSTIWSEAVTGAGGVGTNSNHPFVIMTNGVERVRVFASGNVNVTGAVAINNTSLQQTATLTTSTTTANQAVTSFQASAYRSARFQIQVTSGTSYHVTELMVMHDGTTTYNNEYGTMFTGSSLATFDTDINAGNVRLLVTPANAATTIKVIATLIAV